MERKFLPGTHIKNRLGDDPVELLSRPEEIGKSRENNGKP